MNVDVKKLIDWVLARMAEPTTWRGIIGILSAFGATLSPEHAAAILAGGMGLAGFINIVIKDPKNIEAEVSSAFNDVILPVAEALKGDKAPEDKAS